MLLWDGRQSWGAAGPLSISHKESMAQAFSLEFRLRVAVSGFLMQD